MPIDINLSQGVSSTQTFGSHQAVLRKAEIELQKALSDHKPGTSVNTKTHANVYGCFRRRFTSKRVATMHPDLVAKFNCTDIKTKMHLFQDFVDCGGNLNAMVLVHRCRYIDRITASGTIEAKFESDLLVRFSGDKDHVARVIAKAEIEGRVVRDELAPNDKTKTRYMIPWELKVLRCMVHSNTRVTPPPFIHQGASPNRPPNHRFKLHALRNVRVGPCIRRSPTTR